MIKNIILLICFITITTQLSAQKSEVKYTKIPDALVPYLYASSKDINWFTNAKFGVFIHWGPYSLAKVPASWGRFGPRPGAGRQATDGIPQEEYDNLYKKFNPIKFDADQWIKMVKNAGAKYFIFTTKHHDGFCMFDAKNTNYKITNTPFSRDIAKELADACHKYEIKLFWYYSQPDWHHPDCLTKNNDRYREYMYEHLEQLLTEYGKVDGLFFDGLGTKYYDWDTPRMLKMIRILQPETIVNRRWGGQIPGFPINGDYDNPEQEFGTFEVNRPWEMCSTISEAWSWTGGERHKTYPTIQRMFIQTICSGGNLALNTGPSPKGYINPPEINIYQNMGKWLDKYGKSIYNTKGGPYKPGPWGGSTCKGNTVYLHLLANFADNTKKEIMLPPLPGKVKNSKMLTGGKVNIIQTEHELKITLIGKTNNLDNIIKLELDTNAEQLTPIETFFDKNEIKKIKGSASTAPSKDKSPESIFAESDLTFVEGKKHKNWWQPANDNDQPWIQANFKKKESIEYIMLAEQIRNCSIRKFELQYRKNDKWITFYEGSEIGMNFCLKANIINTDAIRLQIKQTHSNRTPAIGQFKVFRK